MNEESTAKYREDMDKVVTMGVLVEYTGEFLVPKIEEIVNDAIGKSENRMMSYIDRQLTDHITDLFKRLEQKFQSERQFKERVLDIFKRNNLATAEDIAFLEGLVKGAW